MTDRRDEDEISSLFTLLQLQKQVCAMSRDPSLY